MGSIKNILNDYKLLQKETDSDVLVSLRQTLALLSYERDRTTFSTLSLSFNAQAILFANNHFLF
jgi:hypothetical protein